MLINFVVGEAIKIYWFSHFEKHTTLLLIMVTFSKVYSSH